jgi:hypothetical protein
LKCAQSRRIEERASAALDWIGWRRDLEICQTDQNGLTLASLGRGKYTRRDRKNLKSEGRRGKRTDLDCDANSNGAINTRKFKRQLSIY